MCSTAEEFEPARENPIDFKSIAITTRPSRLYVYVLINQKFTISNLRTPISFAPELGVGVQRFVF